MSQPQQVPLEEAYPFKTHIYPGNLKNIRFFPDYINKRKFDYFRFIKRKTIYFIHLKGGDYFLDLGCGTGWAVHYIANLWIQTHCLKGRYV